MKHGIAETPKNESVLTSSVDRTDVEGACPSCGSEALQRYPVLSEGGWFMATKCQDCLESVERNAWNKLGFVVREERAL